MNSDAFLGLSLLDAKTTIAAMPGCVALVTPDGRIAYTSPGFFDLFGVSAGIQVVGTHVREWLHASETAALDLLGADANLVDLRRSFQQPMVYRIRRPDDAFTMVEISSAPVSNNSGQWLGLIAVLRDVTAAWLLEQRIQRNLESQEFLNHLLQLLYRPRDLYSAFQQVLEIIGIFTHASRVSLMENSPDDLSACVTLDWNGDDEAEPVGAVVDGGAPAIPDKFVCLDYTETPSVRLQVEVHGVAYAPGGGQIPPDLSNLIRKWRLSSLVVLPVFGADQLFGLVTIEHNRQAPAWSPEDLDLMRNITRALSNAVARKQAEEIEYNQRVLVETLRDITSVVNSDFTFEQVLEYILSNLNRIVPNTATNILLLDSMGYLQLAHARGYPPEAAELLESIHWPLSAWKSFERVALSEHPLLINDTLKDPEWVMQPATSWIRSYLGAPIRSRGKLLGLINVDAAVPDFFTPEHAVRLKSFADQAAVAIENATLYNEAHSRADQMTTLYEIGLTLSSGLDLQHVLVSIHDQVSRVLPFDQFYVALYDAKSEMLSFPIFRERGEPVQVASRDINTRSGLSGIVIRNRKTLYLNDLKDPQIIAAYSPIMVSGGRARTFVGVPLIAREQVVGVISMQSYEVGKFSMEQVRLLETIANQAALAIDNASIFEEMKQMAITDSLTGLYNRGHFTLLGQTEVDRALRYQRGLAVLMVDIDFFKRVNDSLGHSAGDVVLQIVSKICRSQLRSSDIIGRYGGEEFAIVLPESSQDRAGTVAERIRALVNDSTIKTPKGSIQVTISVGLALLTPEYNTLEELLDCADRAMYQAKQSGRNQVRASLC